MKRIEKTGTLLGVSLIRNNGESFSFKMEDVVDVSTERIDGKSYSVIRLINGYKVVHRSTLQCTFYEIIEEEPIAEELGAVETACSEVKIPLDLENICTDLNSREEVKDFYQKKFKSIINIENEENLFFGFVDECNKVIIPSERSSDGEICFIYDYEDLKSIITEEKEINNYICNLKRSERSFDANKYELKCYYKNKNYLLNKQTSEEVISIREKIGFLFEDCEGKKIIIPKIITTGLFEIMTLDIIDNVSSVSYRTLYKKYKSTKKTTGVTSINYSDAFSYFRF